MKGPSNTHQTAPNPSSTPISFAAAAQKNPSKPAGLLSSSAATPTLTATTTPQSYKETDPTAAVVVATTSPSSSQTVQLSQSTTNGNCSVVAAKANAKSRPSGAAVKGPSTSSPSSEKSGAARSQTSGESSESTGLEPAETPKRACKTRENPSLAPSTSKLIPVQQDPAHGHSSAFKYGQYPQQSPLTPPHQGAHRRDDSASSTHANDNGTPFQHCTQTPLTSAQAHLVGGMVAPHLEPFTSQRPPIKSQGAQIGVMNPHPPHPGMLSQHPSPPLRLQHPQNLSNTPPHLQHHPQPPQWPSPPYYLPNYDATGYNIPMYQQLMPPYAIPPHRPPPSRTFNTRAPPFVPLTHGSKRIAIINPMTKTEVKPLPATSAPSPNNNKVLPLPVVIDMRNPSDEKKTMSPSPAALDQSAGLTLCEKEEQDVKEIQEKICIEQAISVQKEREEREKIESELKEAEELRIREELAEKERLAALAQAEQQLKKEAKRKKKEEQERIAREVADAEMARMENERFERERLVEERVEMEKSEKELTEKELAEESEDKLCTTQETKRLAANRPQEESVEDSQIDAVEIPAVTHATGDSDQKHSTWFLATSETTMKGDLRAEITRTVSAPNLTPSPSSRITDFGDVRYPSHIQSPATTDLQGKFRYDRDFLMQFMNVCTDKPEPLISLLGLGMDEGECQLPSSSGLFRGARGVPPARGGPAQDMGSFRLGERRIGAPANMALRSMNSDIQPPRLGRSSSDHQLLPRSNQLSRPPSQRGSWGGRKAGGQGRGDHARQQQLALSIPLDDVAPLEKTDKAWTPTLSTGNTLIAIATGDVLTQDQVARKVKGLLNKLTLEKFESISDKVVDIANLSSEEEGGTTLKHCIQIIFEKATDEPNFGSVYASLCRKLMEKVSPKVRDVEVEGSSGGKLFRKYLLHRCQEEFFKGWKDKATPGGVAMDDKDSPDLMSDEYYVMMRAKRQGLGLIHFIGELFKLGMLTEKIMHECVKKLLANVKDPEEEEIEGLCKLLTTVGLQLDRREAKNHMDVYFIRMVELTTSTKLASRIRFMVQDVIDLRANHWVNRRAAAGPKTIAAIHEEAAKDAAKQAEEKEMMRRAASSGGGRGLPSRKEQMSRGQSSRGLGDAHHDLGGSSQGGGDGWSTVGGGLTMTKKAGDLSLFGNTSRSKNSGLPSLGAGSVFGSLTKGKRAEAKAASQAQTLRPLASSNVFAALEGEGGDRQGIAQVEKPTERPRLQLKPRTIPLSERGDSNKAGLELESKKVYSDAVPAKPKKTEDEATRSIQNTLEEYLAQEDMVELRLRVEELDECYRPMLVKEFVNQSMAMKARDIDKIATVFKKLREDKALKEEEFEVGFRGPLEFLEDTEIDVPNAHKYAAQLLKAAGLDPSKAAKP